eukprot:CAMPEP_0174962286 /NCGR_PEP_ID=MMETSP0004_2-20121128/4700_1 /TAXON_ID=420556 /ORGANISM="Ochromonas sp., Strain CCMP1393" /LENGTH=305 /DNA_ID=CAMNT_0016210803 /DNA_START=179 /DNA_END=1096 /DNA_ORIENTATION=-
MSSHIEYITELVENPLNELEKLWKDKLEGGEGDEGDVEGVEGEGTVVAGDADTINDDLSSSSAMTSDLAGMDILNLPGEIPGEGKEEKDSEDEEEEDEEEKDDVENDEDGGNRNKKNSDAASSTSSQKGLFSKLFGGGKGKKSVSASSDAGQDGNEATNDAPLSQQSKKKRQKQKFRMIGSDNPKEGAEMLTMDMLEYYKEISLSKDLVAKFKFDSIKYPQILLGWQLVVIMEAGEQAAICVVTGVKTTMISFSKKTLFRLSHVSKQDQWVRLKRSQSHKKQGLFFHPTRKVLFLDKDKHDPKKP